MTNTAPDQSGGGREVLTSLTPLIRMLEWLMRRGCVAQVCKTGEVDFTEMVRIVRCDSSGELNDVASFEAVILHHASQAGLVIAEADGAWRISELGRRRALAARHESKSKTANAGDVSGRAGTSRMAAASRVEINDRESPLAWLRRRRDKDGNAFISEQEFAAGERLRADFTLAQMTPHVTVNWSGSGGRTNRFACGGDGAEISDRAIAARQRVRQALQSVGPEFESILLDVCCYLKGLEKFEREARWPQRSGKIFLAMALRALARHYRIPGDDRSQRACS